MLGVGQDSIILCDKNRKELIKVKFSHIASWGVNSSVFVVVVQKTEFDFKKYYFECYNVRPKIIEY